jgi:potassium efflux system protein
VLCEATSSLCFLLLLFAAPVATAQEPPVAAAAQDPETQTAALQARLDAAASDASLTPDLKTGLLEVLGRALESAKATEALRQTLQRHVAAHATAPARLAEAVAALQAIESRVPGPPAADRKLAELEQGLLAAQKAQADAAKQVSDLDREIARRAERRTAIPVQTGEAKARLDALPAAPPPEAANLDQRLATARRLAWQSERTRLQTELDVLAAELQAYDAEVELLRTERDLAGRRATATKASADAWLTALLPLRAAEAQRAEREARASALLADPRVQQLATGNAELAEAAAALVEQRELVEHEKRDRDADHERLQQDFEAIKKRAELVGATDAVGALLRQRRAQLNDTDRAHQRRTKSRRDRIADAQLKGFDFDERRRGLVEDPETWLQLELGGQTAAASLPGYVIDEARRLRDVRRDLLTQLTEGHAALLNTLIDVENTERRIGALIDEYRGYVAERVLGIRSSAPLWQLDWRSTTQAIAWLFDGDRWHEVGDAWLRGTFEAGWPLAPLVALLAVLALRPWLRRRLVQHGDIALRGTNVAYAPTARAAIDTALLIAPLPALWAFVGFRIGAHPETSEFAKALAAGSIQGSFALLVGLSLGALVRAKGLGEAHFRWQSTTIAKLRAAQPALLFALVPFSFLLATLEVPGEDRWLGSLGGLLLATQLGLLTVIFWRVLHPATGLIGGGVTTTATALFRFRWLWFLLGVGTPVVLLLMVVLGYEYTALQLGRRLQLTVGVLLVGVVVHAMIVRSLVLERRRLQMRRAQERLQATKTGEAAAGPAELVAQEEADPQSLARQTQTLLRGAITVAVLIAAFQIWVDVLPALGILRRVELWTGGTDAEPKAVTLADLLLGLFVLMAGIAAAKNLPALLELLILQRLRMQPGERHAISTLARYGLIALGVVVGFSSIGIGWSKVQWLVAAVSVGLGFGLQEVFANFVSGLILLFERPIRVGDIVTVGTTTGRVTRIRIRATAIQDWDRKELVVPNRQFVTSVFVNWTLSDAIVRWTIPVGVAYGSDTKRAVQILEEIAADSPHVLKDPRPEGVFVGFGDSSLNLQLRLFVDMNAIDYRWMTELHEAIDARFREAGLAMAFPQHDVNVKFIGPVAEFVQRAGARPADGGGPSFPAARRASDR